ncbi:hypothetical protein PNEG_04313 [Pneumocystis murina B123]|uniref:Uncharacterized protein n=1 Tax=Pneumocystis murina (strain B123) TaxID=1069680 RepID=A0A0W4ZWY8_PNEMU|nr:hypothetical protein PNEG_04313 [Pneumocystis murina B123]KTW32882.1 hypothetical protein PNEG_04313 [Pneumocystis murina B123]
MGCTSAKMHSIYIFEIEHKNMNIVSIFNDTDILDIINQENKNIFDIRVGYNGICTIRPDDIMCFKNFNSFTEKFNDSSEFISISDAFLDEFQYKKIAIGTCILIGASLFLSLFNSIPFIPHFHLLTLLNFYFILSGTILLITLTFIVHITISSLCSISRDLNTTIIKINPGINLVILSWVSCIFALISTTDFLFILHMKSKKIIQKKNFI